MAPSVWLVLYLASFALHAVFVSYVAAGAAYALVARDRIAARTRDWLPFMLGAGITAGVGPLLFIQLLYQRRFYTANLLLGPRWGAVVPALILGFYALYLAKASGRLRRIALGVGVLCFGFVAWSWTELHQVMLDDPAWAAMYGRGDRLYLSPAIAPRLAMWLGAMAALYATVAAWQAPAGERRPLAWLALAGLVGATGCAALQVDGALTGWAYVLIAAVGAALAGWLWALRRPAGLVLATVATGVALVAGTIVREASRLALLESAHPTAVRAGGGVVFAITLAVGVVAIAWIVRTVRGATGDPRTPARRP